MSKKELIIIFPLSVLAQRTRLVKLANIASKLDLDITTWAWLRNKEDFNKELSIPIKARKILLKGGSYNSKGIKLYYPLWILAVFFRLIITRPHTTVYCLGFETALPAWAASKIINLKYIFDDADRFSMIIKLPEGIEKYIRKLERKVSEGSTINIIPGYERYEFRNDKQYVLKNNPDSSAIKKMKQVNVIRPNSKLVIYVNGWMGETRGLSIIVELAKRFLKNKVEVSFIAAGKADNEIAQNFINLPNVNYLGNLDNHEALAWYRACDFVFTYYDPRIEINRYAESNKWGDALTLNTLVIVNDEVITANFLRKAEVCITAPYDNIDSIEDQIINLLSHDKELPKMKQNINNLNSKLKFFDQEMFKILQRTYNEKT